MGQRINRQPKSANEDKVTSPFAQLQVLPLNREIYFLHREASGSPIHTLVETLKGGGWNSTGISGTQSKLDDTAIRHLERSVVGSPK
jgi:hypothetical protein